MAQRRYTKRKAQQANHVLIFWIIALAVSVLSITGSFSLVQAGSLILVIILATGVAIIGIAIVIQANKNQKRLQALRTLELLDVDRMTGIQFEKYVAEILKHQGYAVKTTPASGDYGVDLVATKDRVSCAIQLKRYKSSVGQEAIREAVAGKAHYNCTKAMVVVNGYFTRHAKGLAASNNCVLIDRDRLAEWVVEFQEGNKLP